MDLINKCKCGTQSSCTDIAQESYSEIYDTYYCKVCKQWLEDKCDDAECEFCNVRPIEAEME